MHSMYGQVPKEGQRQILNVLIAGHGLTGMNGDIVYLNHGTRL